MVLDRFRCRRRAHAHVSRRPCLDRPCLHTLTGHASANSAPRRPNDVDVVDAIDVDAVDADAGTRLLPSGFSPTYSRACGSTGRPFDDRECSCTRSRPSGGLAFRPDSPITHTQQQAPLASQASQRRRRPCPPGLLSRQAGLWIRGNRYAASGCLSRPVGCVDPREPETQVQGICWAGSVGNLLRRTLVSAGWLARHGREDMHVKVCTYP